jgi:phage terminase small subunit
MAVLENARHERFAQEVFKGSSSRDAYRTAGYSPSNDAATDASASRLLSDAKVMARLAELKEHAAARAEVTVASLTKKLLAIAEKAEGKEEAPMLSVARASYMDIAKLNGLAPDKVQLAAVVADPGDKAGMEELSRWASAALAGGEQEPG